MATIIKRKKAYSVVYNYVDENGETIIPYELPYGKYEVRGRSGGDAGNRSAHGQ